MGMSWLFQREPLVAFLRTLFRKKPPLIYRLACCVGAQLAFHESRSIYINYIYNVSYAETVTVIAVVE